MACPGSANSIRSPGRSARKSAVTAEPARACSRDVRGSAIPYFAKTYFVKPEQSNPSRGELPPHTYFTPRYDSAVRSTRSASLDGGGDGGMRLRAGLGAGVVLPVPSGVTAGSTAMMVDRTVSGDTPRLADDAHPASDTSDAAA